MLGGGRGRSGVVWGRAGAAPRFGLVSHARLPAPKPHRQAPVLRLWLGALPMSRACARRGRRAKLKETGPGGLPCLNTPAMAQRPHARRRAAPPYQFDGRTRAAGAI